MTNYLIADIATLGAQGIVYYNTGSLVFTTIYFAYTKGYCRKRTSVAFLEPDAGAVKPQNRLITNWDGSVDWYNVILFFCGAACQCIIFMAIAYCFLFSRRAGLNIGIAQAIWALNPFFCAVIERVWLNTHLENNHIYGMAALVMCALLVSLSNLLPKDVDPTEVVPTAGELAETTPMYVAVLVSLIMPICCTFGVFLNRYVMVEVGM